MPSRHIAASALLLTTLFATSCSDASEAKEAPYQTGVDQPNPYLAAAESRMAELGRSIDDLKQRASTSAASEDFDQALASLEAKRTAAVAELAKLKASAKEGWKEASERASRAMDDLRVAVDEVQRSLSGS
jgi:type I site-specific restriction endonuclease